MHKIWENLRRRQPQQDPDLQNSPPSSPSSSHHHQSYHLPSSSGPQTPSSFLSSLTRRVAGSLDFVESSVSGRRSNSQRESSRRSRSPLRDVGHSNSTSVGSLKGRSPGFPGLHQVVGNKRREGDYLLSSSESFKRQRAAGASSTVVYEHNPFNQEDDVLSVVIEQSTTTEYPGDSNVSSTPEVNATYNNTTERRNIHDDHSTKSNLESRCMKSPHDATCDVTTTEKATPSSVTVYPPTTTLELTLEHPVGHHQQCQQELLSDAVTTHHPPSSTLTVASTSSPSPHPPSRLDVDLSTTHNPSSVLQSTQSTIETENQASSPTPTLPPPLRSSVLEESASLFAFCQPSPTRSHPKEDLKSTKSSIDELDSDGGNNSDGDEENESALLEKHLRLYLAEQRQQHLSRVGSDGPSHNRNRNRPVDKSIYSSADNVVTSSANSTSTSSAATTARKMLKKLSPSRSSGKEKGSKKEDDRKDESDHHGSSSFFSSLSPTKKSSLSYHHSTASSSNNSSTSSSRSASITGGSTVICKSPTSSPTKVSTMTLTTTTARSGLNEDAITSLQRDGEQLQEEELDRLSRASSKSNLESIGGDSSIAGSSYMLSPYASSDVLEQLPSSNLSYDYVKSNRSKSFDTATHQMSECGREMLYRERGGIEGGSVVSIGEVPSSSSLHCVGSRGSTAGSIGASGTSRLTPSVGGGRRTRTSGGLLEIPKWRMFIRRSSGPPTISRDASTTSTASSTDSFWKDCIHCVLVEDYNRKQSKISESCQRRDTSTLMGGPCPSQSTSVEDQDSDSLASSVHSDSGSRHDDGRSSRESLDEDSTGSKSPVRSSPPIPLLTLSVAPEPEPPEEENYGTVEEDLGNGVTVISLEVPVLPKSGRSASMDSSYLQVPRRNDVVDFEPPPGKSNRSRSVDIALPVGPDGPYIIVPTEKPVPATTQKAIQGEIKISTEDGQTRTLRCAPDWGETAINGDHLWVPTSTSGDLCYVGDAECSKQGPRLCCPVCKITAHTGCIGILIDKIKFHCRPTFKDVGVRQYREQTVIPHHWVHRRAGGQKGRCKQCGKSFQSKLSFGSKEIVALSCSWCKSTYHNKESCFTIDRLTEMCKLGAHGDLIIPPSWIIKLPRKGSFKSSIRRPPKVKRSSSRRNKQQPANNCNNNSNQNNKSTAATGMLTISTCEQTLKPQLSDESTISDSSLHPFTSSDGDSQTDNVIVLRKTSTTSIAEEDNNNSQKELNPYTSSSASPPLSSSPIANTSCPVVLDSSSAKDLTVTETETDASSATEYTITNTLKPTAPAAINQSSTCHRSFVIKPIPSSTTKPLLVFINPKSGGNQGGKLIQKFQWLLNPRQVFDLSQGGPRMGLELYKKVPNLRILACGGDGTAGWIFSALDDLGIRPPVAVLPLGTGNDLARAFGWGGGYTDEPVSKILFNVKDGEVVQLDRWDVIVEKNVNAVNITPVEQEASSSSIEDENTQISVKTKNQASSSMSACDEMVMGVDYLPTNVVNNYFSIGVDAHIALEFHEAREAHPERFNSRLRNKMFYGQAGGKDLLQRKWKDLCNYITLECDGVDLTQRLKDLKVHSLLFLNIPSYGGGTRPWGGNSPVYETPRTDDKLIEVIGLTTYQLPLLQAGGHGSCIAQCRSATIITTRTIPMQVDGEPCRLLPSIIQLKFRNQANVIAKAKTHTQSIHAPIMEKVTLSVRKLNLMDYETYHYEKDRLKEVSIHLGDLTIKPNLELDRVRLQINRMVNSGSVTSTFSTGTGSRCDSPSHHPSRTQAFVRSHTTSYSSSASTESTESGEGDFKRLSASESLGDTSLSPDWCFIDSCTAERFFRIDRAQEHLHYVVDVCNDDLFILDSGGDADPVLFPVSSPTTPCQEPKMDAVGVAAAVGRQELAACMNRQDSLDLDSIIQYNNSCLTGSNRNNREQYKVTEEEEEERHSGGLERQNAIRKTSASMEEQTSGARPGITGAIKSSSTDCAAVSRVSMSGSATSSSGVKFLLCKQTSVQDPTSHLHNPIQVAEVSSSSNSKTPSPSSPGKMRPRQGSSRSPPPIPPRRPSPGKRLTPSSMSVDGGSYLSSTPPSSSVSPTSPRHRTPSTSSLHQLSASSPPPFPERGRISPVAPTAAATSSSGGSKSPSFFSASGLSQKIQRLTRGSSSSLDKDEASGGIGTGCSSTCSSSTPVGTSTGSNVLVNAKVMKELLEAVQVDDLAKIQRLHERMHTSPPTSSSSTISATSTSSSFPFPISSSPPCPPTSPCAPSPTPTSPLLPSSSPSSTLPILCDSKGMTVLHYAAAAGREAIVQYLINCHTFPRSVGFLDHQDRDGNTALHVAVEGRHRRICGLLAVAGCSLSLKTHQGLTAKDLALKMGDEHLAAYLDHFEKFQGSLKDRESTL